MKALFVLCLGLASLGAVAHAQDAIVAEQTVPDQPVPDQPKTAPDQPKADQPTAPVAAVTPPVSASSKSAFSGFFEDLVSPRALLATAPGTLLDQIHEFPKQWGSGARGAEKRAASLYGQFVIGDLIERSVKAIDKEDTRYRRLGAGNFFTRTGHAVAFTVVARTPNGFSPAYSTLANDYGSWAIATLWSPRSLRNPESIFEWGTGNVGVRAGGNFLREFWPDVKGLFRKSKN
jgi:hypothetical protein